MPHYQATPCHLRLFNVEHVINACDEAYFVTLTSRRRLDQISLSTEVSKLIDRLNRALYGTHYTRKKTVRLVTIAVQELTLQQGWHVHILIGIPNGSRAMKANPCTVPFSSLVVTKWIALDRASRSANAQNVQVVTYFNGVLAYVQKTIRDLSDMDQVDFLNTQVS